MGGPGLRISEYNTKKYKATFYSICPPVFLADNFYVCLQVFPFSSFRLSVRLSLRLSVCLWVCLVVCLLEEGTTSDEKLKMIVGY